MRKLNESGMSALLIPLVLTIILFLSAAGFGAWAYMERADYKNNSEAKSQVAAARAVEAERQKLQAEFAEREKQPLKAYSSPAAFGSVRIMYPKTWAAYVVEQNTSGGTPIEGYFHPVYVPSIQNHETEFAVRLQVMQRNFDQELKTYDANTKNGKVKITPYRAPQLPNILGVRVDGEIAPKKNGTVIMFPLRDKIIKISSDSQAFVKDLDEFVLPNLTFVP